jgi:hypothetical protein
MKISDEPQERNENNDAPRRNLGTARRLQYRRCRHDGDYAGENLLRAVNPLS